MGGASSCRDACDKGYWSVIALGFAFLVAALGGQGLSAQPVTHPLDPFTTEEYAAAVAVLKTADRIDDDSRYPLLILQEPAKSEVLRWTSGDPLHRQAFVIVKQGRQTFEAVVDLTGAKLALWKEIAGVQPGVLMEEWTGAQEMVLAHPEVQAALRKRGFPNVEGVVCLLGVKGQLGHPVSYELVPGHTNMSLLSPEDHSQRRAGLGMVEALGQLNTQLGQERGVHLAVRLGIHTGLVVVGEVGSGTRQEQLALGETPNLAARLQGIAAPNTLVISAATLQLLGGFFACESLGTPPLKGVAQPLEVYQVLYERTARSGERLYEAELYRLKGELLLQQATGSGDEAETCLHQALEIARQQQAKSLELRAAISLSRLWQRQGKHERVGAVREPPLLGPICRWFTEGFDTADLQEAKALLEGLS